MHKKIKKIIALICICLLIPSFPKIVYAEEAYYDPGKAVAYAQAHWNDGVGLCAEFVSNCINAGGSPSWSRSCTALRGQLRNSGFGEEYTVTLSGGKLYKSACPNLTAGDVVLYYCPQHNDGKSWNVHAVLCNGFDDSGVMKAFSHNNANSGSKAYSYPSCGEDNHKAAINTAHVYHFTKTKPSVSKPSGYNLSYSGNDIFYSSDLLYLSCAPFDNNISRYDIIMSYSDGREIRMPNVSKDQSVYLGDLEDGTYSFAYEIYNEGGSFRGTAQNGGVAVIRKGSKSWGTKIDLGDSFEARIQNANSGTYVYEGYNSNVMGGSNQERWKFERQADGSYKIKTNPGGKYLSVEGDGYCTSGTNVAASDTANSDRQKWNIYKNSAGKYIFNPLSAKDAALDLDNCRADDGTNVHIFTFTEHPAQQFNIIAYSDLQSVAFEEPELTLRKNTTYTLGLTFTPLESEITDVLHKSFTSSNKEVATVDDRGVITAHQEGECTIQCWVYTDYGTGLKRAKCKVNVVSDEVLLDWCDFKNYIVYMNEGETHTLQVKYSPSLDEVTEEITEMVWMSSDESVVTVCDGVLTAVGAGTSVIRLKIKTSVSGEHEDSICHVIVDKDPDCIATIEGISVSPEYVDLKPGGSAWLDISYFPTDAGGELPDNGNVEWASSEPDVVSVSNGKIEAVGAGTAVIAARFGCHEAYCTVNVPETITEITFEDDLLRLAVGELYTLSPIYHPESIMTVSVTWSSSDESVAVISDTGTVTAIGAGEAKIIIEADGITGYCMVSVEDMAEVKLVMLNKSALSLAKGSSHMLYSSYSPLDAVLGTVSWASSDDSVAVVDGRGEITAMGAGEADIALTVDSHTATCHVSVYIPVQSYQLNVNELDMSRGDAGTLHVTYLPEDADFGDECVIQWGSTDETVAKVVNGKVTAISEGTATIFADVSQKDPEGRVRNERLQCLVTVRGQESIITDVSFDKSEIRLSVDEKYTLIPQYEPVSSAPKRVAWSSMDPWVAEVSRDGVITAVGEGSTSIMIEADDTFAAICSVIVYEKENEHTVSYNSRGGSSVGSVTVGHGERLPEPDEPERDGYDFSGWYKDGYLTRAWDFSKDTVTSDMTLYAKWIKSTGEICVTLSSRVLELTVGKTEKLGVKIEPASAAAKGAVWKSSNSRVAVVGTDGTVKAVAEGTATITATTKEGGKMAACSVTVKKDAADRTDPNPADEISPIISSSPRSIKLSPSTIYLATGEIQQMCVAYTPNNSFSPIVSYTSSKTSVAVVDGYGFVKAVGKGTAKIKCITANGKTATCTVKVLDGGQVYTIRFEGNGGKSWDREYSPDMPELHAVKGKPVKLTENVFIKTGYIFNGWNTKADGRGIRYKNGATVKDLAYKNAGSGKTVTLYAQWKPIKYKIKYVANIRKAKGSMAVSSMTYGVSSPLRKNRFKKAGYTFAGWSLDREGEGALYNDGEMVKNLTSKSNGTVTLYAQWE